MPPTGARSPAVGCFGGAEHVGSAARSAARRSHRSLPFAARGCRQHGAVRGVAGQPPAAPLDPNGLGPPEPVPNRAERRCRHRDGCGRSAADRFAPRRHSSPRQLRGRTGGKTEASPDLTSYPRPLRGRGGAGLGAGLSQLIPAPARHRGGGGFRGSPAPRYPAPPAPRGCSGNRAAPRPPPLRLCSVRAPFVCGFRAAEKHRDPGPPLTGRPGPPPAAADLDGAGVLAVVQQPHGAVVLALQVPAAATHPPAQHLPEPGCGARSGRCRRSLRSHPAAARCGVAVAPPARPYPAAPSPLRAERRGAARRGAQCPWPGRGARRAGWGRARGGAGCGANLGAAPVTGSAANQCGMGGADPPPPPGSPAREEAPRARSGGGLRGQRFGPRRGTGSPRGRGVGRRHPLTALRLCPKASARVPPGLPGVGGCGAASGWGGGVTERAAVRERLTVGCELPSRSGKNRCRPGAAEGSSRSHSLAVCRTGSARWCFHSGAAVTALRAELGAESPPGRELLSRGSLPTEGNFYISLFWTKWTLTVISAQLAAAAAALRGENHGTCAQLGTGSALCSPFQQSCR